jgi:hypothetical protein
MKNISVLILFIILVPFHALLAQEKIDVIYLNNGDIAKGLIVENKPNDYLKIEIPGGSIFTFKYSDILLITKEEISENINTHFPKQPLVVNDSANKLENFKNVFKISISGGLSIPFSTEYFSDYWTQSYNFGGGFDVYLTSQLALQGYVDYNKFAFDDTKAQNDLGKRRIDGEFYKYIKYRGGGAVDILNLSTNLKYYLIDITQKVSPYILGGVGYAMCSFSDLASDFKYKDDSFEINGTETISGESFSALAINFGFGIDFQISSNISIFVDARYVPGFTSGNVLNFRNIAHYRITDYYYGESEFNADITETYTLNENASYIPLRVGISISL